MHIENSSVLASGSRSDLQYPPTKRQLTPSPDRTAARGLVMKTIARVRILLTVLAASLWVTSPAANASELIYSQYSDGQSTYGPSLVWSPDSVNAEVADEFNVVANID